MKKTITILLLTAICITVFTSCDLGNGLVAELLGGVKDAPIGEQIYPTDEYIGIETDIFIEIEPVEPPVEIETTPPYEIVTEYWTGEQTTAPETGCDCGSCDLDAPAEPRPTHRFSIYTLVAVVNGEQIVGRYFTSENSHEWNGQADVDDSISALIVRGCWRCPEKGAILGYSIDGGEILYDESFVTRAHGEWTINGTAALNYCDIVIPVSELSEGSHTVTCYARATNEQGEYTMQMIEFVVNRTDTTLELPTLETCGFIGITLHTPNGKSAPLMTFGELKDWNGVLDLGEELREWESMLNAEDFTQGELRFRGYATYDVMPHVTYYLTVMNWYGDTGIHSEPISIVTPDASDVALIGMKYEKRMTVFEFTVPVEALWNTGDTIYLSGVVPIDALIGGDAPVIYEQQIDVLMPQPEIETEIAEETQE